MGDGQGEGWAVWGMDSVGMNSVGIGQYGGWTGWGMGNVGDEQSLMSSSIRNRSERKTNTQK